MSRRNVVNNAGIQGLNKALDDTRAKLDQERKALQYFSDKNHMASWNDVKKNAVDNLNALKKQQADKTSLLNQLQTLSSEQILNQFRRATAAPKCE